MATRRNVVPEGSDMDDENALRFTGRGSHELEPIDPEIVEESAVERIQRMLRTVSDDQNAVVKLYRVIGPNKFEWCDDYSPEDFEAGGQKLIRDKWGAAEYQIRLIGDKTLASGVRQRGILAKDNQRIAASSEPAKVVDSSSTDVARMIQMLAEGQTRLLEAITNRPQVDPMAQMAQTLSLMTAMREAMGLNQPQAPARTGISEIMEAVREMRAVAEEINPPKDDDSPMAMLPKIIDMIGAAREQQASQAPALAFPVVGVPESINAVSSPVTLTSDQPAPEQSEMSDLIKHLDVLIAMASAQSSVIKGAEYVYENLPDEMIDVLATEGWFALLAQVAPKVAPHQDWFTKVRDESLSMFNDGETDEPEGNPAP